MKTLTRALALSLVVLATGCGGDQVAPVSVAQCLALDADAGQLQRWGDQMSRRGQVSLARWDTVGCPGGWSVALDKDKRRAVEDAMPEFIATKDEFRRGAYASLLPPGASAQQRGAFADLGFKLEEFAIRRNEALNCLGAKEGVLHMMAETDLPFAMAVTGVNTGLVDPGEVYTAASQLVDRTSAIAEVVQEEECLGQVDTRFRAYAAELGAFLDGSHPWAPGCRAVSDADGMTLKCDGAPAKVDAIPSPAAAVPATPEASADPAATRESVLP